MDYYARFTNSATRTPITGLTLAWSFLIKALDGSVFTPQPTFSELTNGYYKFTVVPTQELLGQIDGGAALALQDRYADVGLSPTDAYLDAAISGIKAKTDNLPGSPAAVGSAMTLTAAYDPAKTAAQPGDVAVAEAAILDAMPSASIVIPLIAGGATTIDLVSQTRINLKRGDTYRLLFSLGRDCTGWAPWFGAKQSPGQAAYDMELRQVTYADQSAGTGYIDLSSGDTAHAGTFFGELELRSGNERNTPEAYTFKVIDDIVRDS